MKGFIVVIPARYASTRLPGKPLLDINGKPMLQHVYERATESAARDVLVATDDERIATAAERFGARVCMTGDQHRSGTERIAEVCDLMDWDDDQLVVNLQGDEPTMPSSLIDQCGNLLRESDADMGTLASPFVSQEDFRNPNVVKVICDDHDRAIYFSRAPIPYCREGQDSDTAMAAARQHHGIYSYRCGVLRRLVAAEPSPLETCEQLEQLRALALGMTIRVAEPRSRPGPGIDTQADLDAARKQI